MGTTEDTPPTPELVQIDGHTVDAHLADWFFDGKTGRRLTDEEWDETQRRRKADA